MEEWIYSAYILSPGERAPDTHWIGGWVGHSSGLDAVEKRKNLRESNPDLRYTD
jgi:hypothetical protein